MAEQKISELIDKNRLEDALKKVEIAISQNKQDDNLHFLRGKILWRMGKRSEALDAYEIAATINPNSPAKVALEQGKEVFSFFNPDLLNP